MSTLYENYITGDTNQGGLFEPNWDSQTFTPSTNHIITSVKLKLWRVGSPGTLTISIRATSSSLPTGSDLAVGTTDGDTLPTSAGSAEWREITFTTGYLLIAGTEYAIVARALSGNGSNYGQWRYDDFSPTYTDGQRAFSSNSGASWTAASTDDFMFEEYGDPQGSGGGGTIFPAEAITRVTNLIHRYNRKEGTYTLELALGEVTSDFGLPEWLSRPQASIPETDKRRDTEDVANSPEMFKSVEDAVNAALIRVEANRQPGINITPLPTLEEFQPEPFSGASARVTGPQQFPVISQSIQRSKEWRNFIKLLERTRRERKR